MHTSPKNNLFTRYLNNCYNSQLQLIVYLVPIILEFSKMPYGVVSLNQKFIYSLVDFGIGQKSTNTTTFI